MSHPDPALHGTPRRSGRSMSWLIAGAAAIVILLAIIFWNSFYGTEDATVTGDAPVVEKMGEGIAEGPGTPLDGAASDESNAVADEAARENRIIEEKADQTGESGSVVDAQRTAEEVQSEEQNSAQ